jgi:hypothetical protein
MGISDPIGTIKNISELVKKYNDIDLMQKIVTLHSDVFALQMENLELRKRLDLREKMHMSGPFHYYFQDGDEVPFCPKCWEKDGKPIHLDEPYTTDLGYTKRFCRVCKEEYYEKTPPRRPVY